MPEEPRIMSIKRRYEVFISSTFDDLKEIRKDIIEQTLAAGNFPTAMEYFSPGAWTIEHIDEAIKNCDVFVLIIGSCYGAETQEGGPTFTKHEYDMAKTLGKSIIPFILNEDEYMERRSSLPDGSREREHDADLRELREYVKLDSRIITPFSLKDGGTELITKYVHALSQTILLLKDASTGGWIRSDEHENIEKLIKIGTIFDKNPFFGSFVDRLDRFEVLTNRTTEKEHEKRSIAKFIVTYLLPDILNSGVRNIFGIVNIV